MNIHTILAGPLTGLLLLSGVAPAAAGEPLVVYTDQSRIITVARTPGTVVVGNPSIADVTIQEDKVFLHARGYGTTNILILDDQGNHLADYDVTVQTSLDNGVTVYRAGSQFSYVCDPDCESTLHIGDFPGYFGEIAKQQQKRTAIALGQKDGETAQAPEGQAPPQ